MVLIDVVRGELYNRMMLFPSPCGDYGSYQSYALIAMTLHSTSFRPLAGIMVLIGHCERLWDER